MQIRENKWRNTDLPLPFLPQPDIKSRYKTAETEWSKAESRLVLVIERNHFFTIDYSVYLSILSSIAMADNAPHSPELALDKIYLDESYNLYIPEGQSRPC